MRYFRDDNSQRKISRELSISRTTVQKYIKEFENKHIELKETDDSNGNRNKILALIEEMVSEPKYDVTGRKKVKLTDEIIQEIDNLMKKNKENIIAGRKKQVMKKIDIYDYLIDQDYDIGYTTVCNYIKEFYDKKEAFIRQVYDFGNTIEFDWGDVKLTIDGKETVLKMGLFTTAKSSFHFPWLYRNQKMENFLDIHVKAFKKTEGVYGEVVYDNMKTAVRKFVGRNEKEATDDLVKISLYYGFKYRFCNARSGNEKGHVEKGVEFVRRKVFSLRTDFASVEEANKHLSEKIEKLNQKNKEWLNGKSPKDILEQEKEYLIPLKPAYDPARRVEARVSKYCVITIDQNKYSVPDYLVGKFVKTKIYPEYIEIYYKENLVAKHKRSYQSHNWTIDINHFVNTLKKKPGALHSSVGRHQMAPELQQIYQEYYTNNPKDFIVLLEVINEKGLHEVLAAVDKLSKIKKDIVNTDNIKNIVTNSVDVEIRTKDESIKEQALKQVLILNKMFNLGSVGGCNNERHIK